MSAGDEMSFEEAELQAIEKLAEFYRATENPRFHDHEFAGITGLPAGLAQKMFEHLQPTPIHFIPIRKAESILGPVVPDVGDYVVDNGILLTLQATRDRYARRTAAPDRVEGAYAFVRQHRYLAPIVIALLALTFLVTLINQSIELCQKLGWLG